MAPEGDPGTGLPPADDMMAETAGVAGATGKGSYVPPALRNKGGAAAAGERMPGGKFERDDLATLRVTNVSFKSTMCGRQALIRRTGLRMGRRGRAAGSVQPLGSCHTCLPG